MITLDDASARVGALVFYSPTREYGHITKANDKYVFVRFGDDFGSKACRPSDLWWSSKGDERSIIGAYNEYKIYHDEISNS